MRIKQIEINGLFGMFNHIVPLNLPEHITIIYGINGIGKTMLFKILDSFFNSNFSKLVSFPFDSLIIEFDNKDIIKFLNSDKEFFIEFKSKKKTTTFDLSKLKSSKQIKDERIIRQIQHILPFPISKYSENEFILHETNEILTVEEIFDRYSELLPSEFKQKVSIPNKAELDKIIKNTNLYFIQTQRLIAFNYLRRKQQYAMERDYGLNKIETVKKYSEELSEIIQERHREYAKRSEEYELSLGKRLRSKEVKTYSDQEELKRENKFLEAKRSDLKSVGLFEDIKEDYSNIPDTIDEIERAVLSVNIQDMKNKLKIFDELYEKLKIFLNVLNNKRFSYKKISIHPKKGFVFKNDNGKPLEVTELSSGEQHEIVLFYELLFKVPENSLVLIDEPEISLHVVWQKEFLTDLEDIVKIRNFDILLATHSPSIINGNWDLTVELNKDKNDEK
jgi:predicted ATP-binding protein involved in virulence